MTTHYDGVLRRQFLLEHVHKGFAAALAVFLPAFSLAAYAGLDIIAAMWVASAVGLALIIAVCTYQQRFSLDTSHQRYRSYLWIAGLRFGKWQPLPAISHIVVKPYSHSHYLSLTDGVPVELGSKATERKWQVLLSVVGKPIGIIAAYLDQEEAIRSAASLSKLLNVEVTK
ncbi:hypothetical protein [Hymenobacter norwichensis]|uniref:hypothetical protein n=1 Tax=Hymenobacter norwichensis TaxID=223903 RepID=UPI0003B3164E|nr:hypothetical protein [Hymenobacter norwichensis]